MNKLYIAPLAHAHLDACAAIAAQAPDPWSRAALLAAVENPRRLCLGAFGPLSGGDFGPSGEDAGAEYPPVPPSEALLGFASFFIVEDTADLEMLVVDAAARRHGVAQGLLAAGRGELVRRGAKRLLLEVRAGNRPAVALYQKLGFRQLALRPGMYARPTEDGLLMAKGLQEP